VRYTKIDGEVVNGTFLPILFEDFADPVVTGREELGAPKWACSIDISDPSPTSKKIALSWRGTTFGTIELDGLGPELKGEALTIPKPTPDDGILMYRYVPAVGEPGKADVEYAVFDAYEATTDTKKTEGARQSDHIASDFMAEQRIKFGFEDGEERKYAREARLKFDAKGWDKLPTVNHIVEALAEIPVYSILEAKTEFVSSVRTITSARRID
jgi:hypothetical protein